MRRNCCGSLRPNARRSGEANGEDRHVQTRVGDLWLFCLQWRLYMFLHSIQGDKLLNFYSVSTTFSDARCGNRFSEVIVFHLLRNPNRGLSLCSGYILSFRNFSLTSQFRSWHEHQHDLHGLTVGSWRNCIRLKMLEILTRRSSFARGYKPHSWRLLRYRPANWAAHMHAAGR